MKELVEESIVEKETGALLKQKGFNYIVSKYYDEKTKQIVKIDIENLIEDPSKNPNYIPLPTLYLAAQWLREKYRIHIFCTHTIIVKKGWFPNIIGYGSVKFEESLMPASTFSKAYENGIVECLNKLKDKKA